MFEDPKNYKIIHRCALQMKDGWKHEAIQRFENHVTNLIKTYPKHNIKSITDTTTLRDFFRDLFSFNDVESIFWWPHDIIDLSMSSNACRTFIYGKVILMQIPIYLLPIYYLVSISPSDICTTYWLTGSSTEVYIIFAVQIKLYLDDPKVYGRTKLHRIWDNLGKIARFQNLGIDGFTLRPPKVKTRKRKRDESPLPDDIFEGMEYGEDDDLGNYVDYDGI